MDTSEYKLMYNLEKEHWWFCGKRNLINILINKYLHSTVREIDARGSRLQGGNRPILIDIGCGTGQMLQELRRYGDAIGCDINMEALTFCVKRGRLPMIAASAEAVPFVKESVNLVCMLDVLYHKWIRNDLIALKQTYTILKPGGILILTDAAFQFLYSGHDRAAFVRHRYTKQEMKEKLLQAGFIVRKLSYYNCFLFPIAASIRIFKKYIRAGNAFSDLFRLPSFLNTLLKKIMFVEGTLLNTLNLPLGLSVVAVAQKPG